MAFWLPMATTALGAGAGFMFGGPAGAQIGGALGGAAGGAIAGEQKYKAQKAKEDQTRAMRAGEQRYSYGTGIKDFTPIDFAGSQANEMQAGALGWGLTGASLGKGAGDLFNQNALQGSMYAKPGMLGTDQNLGYAPAVQMPQAPTFQNPGVGSSYEQMLRQSQQSPYTYQNPFAVR
jgi:hypothetical protein